MPNDDLNIAEKRDLVIQAGIQIIPYVGGSLCTLYFGTKQEKRFKRLESFYAELAEDLKLIKGAIPPIEEHDAPLLEAIMESLHDKVESEPTLEKRRLFKNYLINTLQYPESANFDERKYFLDTLDDMTVLECEVLMLVSTSAPLEIREIRVHQTEQYAIIGSIGRLKSRGFVFSIQNNFEIGIDNSLHETAHISSFGQRFHSFCLET